MCLFGALKAIVVLAVCSAAEGQFLRGFNFDSSSGYMSSFSSAWSRVSNPRVPKPFITAPKAHQNHPQTHSKPSEGWFWGCFGGVWGFWGFWRFL